MSESIPIFKHTTESGTITPALIPARGAFVRKTNLPADWKTVRIALLYSLRGASATDSPVAESIPASTNALQRAQIGLSNGAGMVGNAGVRFVGAGTGGVPSGPQATAVGYTGTCGWHAFDTSTTASCIRLGGRVADGTTETDQTSAFQEMTAGFKTPLDTTEFCEGLMVELSVVTAAKLTMRFAVMRPLSPASAAAVGVALEDLIVAKPGNAADTTGGWWDSDTGVGCTHLFVRTPYINNRLVIHGYKVVQVK